MTKAKIKNADIRGARFTNTICTDVDFDSARFDDSTKIRRAINISYTEIRRVKSDQKNK